MKTLLLTIATVASAMIFSSCGCCNNSGSQSEVKHYDYKGRLVKEVKPSGNYNTYHYDGVDPDYVAPRGPRSVAPTYNPSAIEPARAPKVPSANYNGNWKPRLP